MSVFQRFWYRKNQLLYPAHTELQDKISLAEAKRSAKEAQRDACPEGSAEYKYYNDDVRSLTDEVTALHHRYLSTGWPWWVDMVSLGSVVSGLLYLHPRWVVYRHHHGRPLLISNNFGSVYQAPMRNYLAKKPDFLTLMKVPIQFPMDYFFLLPFVFGIMWRTCPLTYWSDPDEKFGVLTYFPTGTDYVDPKRMMRCAKCGAVIF
jgi:hypothetical protein